MYEKERDTLETEQLLPKDYHYKRLLYSKVLLIRYGGNESQRRDKAKAAPILCANKAATIPLLPFRLSILTRIHLNIFKAASLQRERERERERDDWFQINTANEVECIYGPR